MFLSNRGRWGRSGGDWALSQNEQVSGLSKLGGGFCRKENVFQRDICMVSFWNEFKKKGCHIKWARRSITFCPTSFLTHTKLTWVGLTRGNGRTKKYCRGD
ncbi:hypothetical protein H5410_014274 [Solanum commersonii]|uniref:Uncharacterized protein n=1 Tax=Solanum commersonii TaxID=4109 RepID=A0A9J5ZQV8_SOLCO|nr:hypothetical protein H5410_014274 [Solanum commersonii]